MQDVVCMTNSLGKGDARHHSSGDFTLPTPITSFRETRGYHATFEPTRISCRAMRAFALPFAIPSIISLRRISET